MARVRGPANPLPIRAPAAILNTERAEKCDIARAEGVWCLVTPECIFCAA